MIRLVLSRLPVLLVIALILTACSDDDEKLVPPPEDLDQQLNTALLSASGNKGVDFYKFPSSTDYSSIPQDQNNPITAEKVELGKFLFHETGIATNPKLPEGALTYSCASCHHAKAGFQAGKAQGIADGGMGFGIAGEGRVKNPNYDSDSVDVQPVRTPSALNIAYQPIVLWNGQFGANSLNVGTEAQWTEGTPKAVNLLGFDGTETQAIAGLKVHRMITENSVCETNPTYKGLFDVAFPGKAIDNETAGLAIAAYERTLLANKSPFQLWLNGNNSAMTDQQKKGAVLFFDKANCFACHNGPALNTMEFHALGMKDLHDGIDIFGSDPLGDGRSGRGGFTKNADDMFKFKVPQLYNLKDSPFYGHGASFTSVRDVIVYKNGAISENANVPEEQLAAEFSPLSLTNEEIDQLTAFVEHALYDPDLLRYVPDELPSGNCFPNADEQSKIDLNCD